jgi:putative ABC transport system ATP-binding protein
MTHALRSIDLSVQEGDFLSITGPSGSGKSTLLNILGLLEGFSGGHYAIGGVDVGGMRDAALSALRNEKIGFVFQAFNLIPDLTIQANVEVPCATVAWRQPNAGSVWSRHWPRSDWAAACRTIRRTVGRAAAARGDRPRHRGYAGPAAGDEPTGNLDSQMSRGSWRFCVSSTRAA